MEESTKDDGVCDRQTGHYLAEDEDRSRRTICRFLLKCSPVWLPLLPSYTFLPAYKQWFVCIPVAFWVLTPGGLSHRGQCACISVSTTKSICIHSYLMLVHAHTDAWPSVYKLFSFYSCGRVETIFHLQNTRWHHQMSHPFHLLPLPSVTPASTPCLMDFQMQVHDFFQDLTGIFLCV